MTTTIAILSILIIFGWGFGNYFTKQQDYQEAFLCYIGAIFTSMCLLFEVLLLL